MCYAYAVIFIGALPPMIQIEPTAEHPIPYDLSDELPKTQSDAIAVAVNTVNLIEQLGGGIDFNEKDGKQAVDLVTKAAKTPTHITASGQAKAVAQILKTYDFQAVADAQQARNFITNKLIQLADCGDPKLELRALELLGKHSDIGIFTERSEITVRHTSADSLEESIKERVRRLLHSTAVDVTPLDDLDAQLGVVDEVGTFSRTDDDVFSVSAAKEETVSEPEAENVTKADADPSPDEK